MQKRSLQPGHSLVEGIDYRILENSWVAKLAALKLNCRSMAIVTGKSIHLYNAGREEFLSNKTWLNHELCHVRQYKEHGFINFIYKYLRESIRHGYYKNKYEVEAREAELSG